MKLAVIGATGLVGQVICKVLEERKLPITELIPAASEKSVGKTTHFNGAPCKVVSVENAVAAKPDIALFSAGASTSLEWAPKFAEIGTTVIDNSSAWRMEKEIPLIVPEVNGDVLKPEHKIIANPNCSTIQLVMALAPLHKAFGIQRMIISTYQSVSGSGAKALNQLENERTGTTGPMTYPHQIDKNCLPHCDVFLDNQYTKEEMKLVNETRKIMGDDTLKITATCVRVPVVGGHSESVNVTFRESFTTEKVVDILQNTDGVTAVDDPQNNLYPMPISAAGKDDVFVGRIRRDDSHPNSLNLWIVADNLRKGAATNAVQIAELIWKMK